MTIAPFRLAFRVEGNKWTAYAAKQGTMDGAIWMGAVAIGIVENDELKRRFMDIMKDFFLEFLKERGIEVDYWSEDQAPESERTGNA
ncbi:MAG TPA: hypothetical protein VKE42_07755 [Candidatus Cybelea sp.]|nr:hypothetical protein [Candidatus Cybelea sp.]